jgi:hypothetical protein
MRVIDRRVELGGDFGVAEADVGGFFHDFITLSAV